MTTLAEGGARARIPAVARRDFLDALDGLPITPEQQRYVTWAADTWDQPTLNALADVIRQARAEQPAPIEVASVPQASMITANGWVLVDLPGGCKGWNDAHDCGREDGHPGDHVCRGCHDQWNRGEWDEYDPDDEEYYQSQRPEHRCADEVPA